MNAQLLSVVLSLALFVLIAPFLIGRSDDGDMVLPTIIAITGALASGQFLAANGMLLAL